MTVNFMQRVLGSSFVLTAHGWVGRMTTLIDGAPSPLIFMFLDEKKIYYSIKNYFYQIV